MGLSHNMCQVLGALLSLGGTYDNRLPKETRKALSRRKLVRLLPCGKERWVRLTPRGEKLAQAWIVDRFA